jgi:hypothetical protein
MVAYRTSAVDIDVQAFSVISGNSTKPTATDIWAMVQEFKVSESLLLPICFGECTVLDGLNLIDNTLLKGFDHVQISFGTPDTPQLVTKSFRIFNILDRKRVSNAAQTYRLMFCSEELFLASQYSQSKAFKGKLISDVVKDLALNTLKIPKDRLEIEATAGVTDMMVPYMRPFEAINKMARKSLTQTDHPSFMFYETLLEGFKFKSIETLFKQQPVAEYSYNQSKIDSSIIDPFSIVSYIVHRNFDTLSDTQSGKYASNLMTFDILRQSVETIKHDAVDFFNKTMHLEGKGKSSNKMEPIQNRKGDAPNQAMESHSRFVPTTLNQPNNSYIKARDPNIKPHQIEKTDLQRNAFLQNFHDHRVKIRVPGNPTVKSGDVIKLTIISPEDQSSEPKDEVMSGNYIITTITHMMTVDRKFFTEMTVVKDDVKASPTAPIGSSSPIGNGLIF